MIWILVPFECDCSELPTCSAPGPICPRCGLPVSDDGVDLDGDGAGPGFSIEEGDDDRR